MERAQKDAIKLETIVKTSLNSQFPNDFHNEANSGSKFLVFGESSKPKSTGDYKITIKNDREVFSYRNDEEVQH